MRTRRWLKRLAKGVLILLAVVLLADGVLSLVLGRMVASEIARLIADGYPTTIAEIAPKKIPDSENAAVIYAKAFKAMKPSLTSEESEAFSVLLSPEKRFGDPASWDRGMQILARRRHVIALVEQACTRPKCVFPVEWEKGGGALFPHLAKLRSLENLLAADAITSAVDGRTDDAVRSLELGARMPESIAEEPSMISQLVRYACIQIQARSLQIVAQHSDIDSTQAKRLYDVLGAIDLNPGFALVMQAERVFGLWCFDDLRKHPEAIQEYLGLLPCMTDLEHPNEDSWRSAVAPLHSRTPICCADELIYLNAMEDRVRVATLPYRKLKQKRPDLLRDLELPPYAIVSAGVLSYCDKLVTQRDDAIAALDGGRILMALVAYKDRFGGYPRSIGELRAKLGWKLPEDPYSGKDFIYKRRAKGFILYSVGPDLKDDGGQAITGDRIETGSKGDIVLDWPK